MKALPLEDLLDKVVAIDREVASRTSSSIGVIDTRLDYPNTIGGIISLNYTGISLPDCLTIDASFKASYGTERFLYNGKRYLLNDGYSINYVNTSANISFSLKQVGG